ncbi:D-inositol-3-phosphate glycosyltransferase [Mycobacterium intracellulare 1956]|uniref:D-inositol-3-phosphate glycosyltransferase n=1 Tax=Mycobacterium intracellulare 1956 TaxID=1299331 RepID=X8CC49_MYCIT|nr:D-inositol-3-phosphate glycosyltransferase [Mycobacterium intracellulare 1956]
MVDEADRLIVNTDDEARQLITIHHADPARIDVVHPGVDLDVFRPGDRRAARAALGLPPDEPIVAFVGRIQPLKAPDIVLRAAAKLPGVRIVVAGGPSGSGLASPDGLARLADELGITARVTFLPPQSRSNLATLFQAANVVAVPSYSESFGLVALEAQACGTPVAAAAVGGLPVAVRDGATGTLVAGHDVDRWAAALDGLLRRPAPAAGRWAARPPPTRRPSPGITPPMRCWPAIAARSASTPPSAARWAHEFLYRCVTGDRGCPAGKRAELLETRWRAWRSVGVGGGTAR